VSLGSPNRIYLDANAFISSVEGESDALAFLVGQASAGLVELYTSELTLAEVLVSPLKKAQLELVELYELMLVSDDTLSVVPVDRDILRRSADIRAALGNKGADAIHVASAVSSACAAFVSSDKRLRLPDGMTRIDVDRVTGLDDPE
jgi:predicted nucleic acid-binding protein